MSNAKLENLSEQERTAVLEILNQITKTGSSSKLDNILNEDWDEIPVDIHTFLHDKRYLGNALYDNEGRFTIFPYWESKLEEIFPDNISTRYNTIILTGAIGLGKSTIAVICLLYMLYRLLCLKDPYLYYGLQPIDKITISFMNVTLENARGVALDKMNQMILASEWFMSHGEMRGISNFEYAPNKHIELIAASSNNQIIGRAVFCLDGDTIISTVDGDKQIKDLENTITQVYCINELGDVVLSEPCEIKQTAKTSDIYEIELDGGAILRCTPNHRFMLKDGSYKEAQYLTELDNLKALHGNIKIKSINRIKLESTIPMYDVINSNPYHNFLVKADSKYIVSHNCSFEDEVNFSANTTDVEKMKKKMKSIISQVDARMKSRFLRGTYLPTLNIIASSKNSDQSFLDEYINTKKKNESKNTLIVDEPQWVVDNRKDSDTKFFVAVGNKFLANELLPLDASETLVEEYRAKGYTILRVPIGYYENFLDNIDGALTDIAGISTASSLKYISGIRWNEIKTNTYKNPFIKEIIEVGNGKDDFSQYSDFFDLSAVPSAVKRKPLFIHLDMSKTGDKTGISGVYIIGKKPSVENVDSSRELFYQVAFSVSIKAPKGREISFDKNRTFIRWLRSQGFNIRGISADTYQSAQIMQQLTADNFNVSTISVDRVDRNTRQCLPYAYLKSTIYERRLVVYDNCPFLTEEVLGLERESDGSVEHPEHGTMGSKDAIDSVCGALWNASQHAEEYGYEYGENVELFTEFNSESDTDEIAEFELQLMSRNKAHTEHTEGYEQFGINPPEDFEMGVSEGVFIW